jgi:UDP-N-acetylmuramate--alanine ligase
MNIYFSGINGTGLAPLAEMAAEAGFRVFGSDRSGGAASAELGAMGIEVDVGEQTGEFLMEKATSVGVDWFIYTSALPKNHPELVLARKLGIKTSKRDSFIEYLVRKKKLKMVAVAGTHGKTTTTAMIIWACYELGVSISYLVGSTLPWGDSGKYETGSEFLVYEADEYDRNFLKFHPWISVVTVVSYDHPDIYKSREEYRAAFQAFRGQSEKVIENIEVDARLTLAGGLRRMDASLALGAVKIMAPEIEEERIIEILNDFPGVGRRFEKIGEGVYSDYAHHPEEVAATIAMAKELGRKVVAVYEPHQNTRQHEVMAGYPEAFREADEVIWLPTYLTREDENLRVIEPEEFVRLIGKGEVGEAGEELARKIEKMAGEGWTVLIMTAGPAEGVIREYLGRNR